jgi:hypothetical protein
MTLQRPIHQALHGSSTFRLAFDHSLLRRNSQLFRHYATASAIPGSQGSQSSKGPTAIVFLNMGGPSTTDQVGDFLSRLFVCQFDPENAIN